MFDSANETSAVEKTESFSLENLLENFDGDKDFVDEILTMARQDLPARMENLRQLINRQEGDTVRREAHTIKGVAANICAAPLAQAADALEHAGGHAQMSLYVELEVQVAELLTELESHFQ